MRKLFARKYFFLVQYTVIRILYVEKKEERREEVENGSPETADDRDRLFHNSLEWEVYSTTGIPWDNKRYS